MYKQKKLDSATIRMYHERHQLAKANWFAELSVDKAREIHDRLATEPIKKIAVEYGITVAVARQTAVWFVRKDENSVIESYFGNPMESSRSKQRLPSTPDRTTSTIPGQQYFSPFQSEADLLRKMNRSIGRAKA